MLPVGATALDFAFSVHSAVGSKCIGAKVNHKLVPIGHKLRSGDQIEIITSAKQKPNAEWLNLVVTSRAKSKIKDTLKEEKREIADLGKGILERKLNSINASFNQTNIDELTSYYKMNSPLDLYYEIAIKRNELRELKDFTIHGDKLIAPKIQKEEKPEIQEIKPPSKKDSELIIFGESSDKIMYTLANCCKPIPGDDVFGFISTGEGLKIHRTNCPNATRLLANYSHRVVKTKWAKNKEISFLTGLKIIGLDDVGVIHKITNLISGELKVNISAMTIEANDGVFEGNVKVFVHDKEELDKLVNRLLALQGIERVDRYNIDE
jgi:GTP pyrophosphokinase